MKLLDINLLEKQFSVLLARWSDVPLPPANVEILRGGFYAGAAGLLSVLFDEGVFEQDDQEILEAIIEELESYNPTRMN